MDRSKALAIFASVQSHLNSFIDCDPARAITEARALPDRIEGMLLTPIRGAILIDAGLCIRDVQAIRDGIAIFKQLLEKRPKDASLHYNLGNGLVALADQVPYSDAEWYLKTAEERRVGRREFQHAATLSNQSELTATSFTNIGNAFWKAHRWVEAYDAYSRALEDDDTNGVAATGAAKVLLRCVERRIGERDVLLAVAARHLRQAQARPDRIAELAGARALEELRVLFDRDLKAGGEPDLGAASEYERFVARHRLALSPTIEGLDVALKRWDSLTIRSLTEPVDTEHGVPPLFAMFNVMKADFLAARLLAFQALNTTFPDTGVYADTLDYALYGTNQSVLLLAQRACIDVLDKIAVAATEYFGISGAMRSVTFLDRWFEPRRNGQAPVWHSTFSQAAKAGNIAVIALAEMALDMRSGGALSAKREYRHTALRLAHRFGCRFVFEGAIKDGEPPGKGEV